MGQREPPTRNNHQPQLNSKFSNKKENIKFLNSEPEFKSGGSLNERALNMVTTDEYLNKVKMIKNGNTKIKSMEFIMDGIKIELPFNGQKVTQGYLKKETKNVNFLMNHTFQNKYCILDLTKFVFKYAKAPTDKFTFILLKDIIDVRLENDPKEQNLNNTSGGFFSKSSKKQCEQGFNFQVLTGIRVYRMQAGTKTEQIMWARAFTILFELRARVSQNLKTTIDINQHLGIDSGATIEDYRKAQETLGMNNAQVQSLQASLDVPDADPVQPVQKRSQSSSVSYTQKLRNEHKTGGFKINKNFASGANNRANDSLDQAIHDIEDGQTENSNRNNGNFMPPDSQQQRERNKGQKDPNKRRGQSHGNQGQENQQTHENDASNVSIDIDAESVEITNHRRKPKKEANKDTVVPDSGDEDGKQSEHGYGAIDFTPNVDLQNGRMNRTQIIGRDEEDAELRDMRAQSSQNNRQAAMLLEKKRRDLKQKMEANKQLMKATVKLGQFQRLMISPKGAAKPEAAGSSPEPGAAASDARAEAGRSNGKRAAGATASGKHLGAKTGMRSPIKSPQKRTLQGQEHGDPDEEYEYYSEEEYGEEGNQEAREEQILPGNSQDSVKEPQELNDGLSEEENMITIEKMENADDDREGEGNPETIDERNLLEPPEEDEEHEDNQRQRRYHPPPAMKPPEEPPLLPPPGIRGPMPPQVARQGSAKGTGWFEEEQHIDEIRDVSDVTQITPLDRVNSRESFSSVIKIEEMEEENQVTKFEDLDDSPRFISKAKKNEIMVIEDDFDDNNGQEDKAEEDKMEPEDHTELPTFTKPPMPHLQRNDSFQNPQPVRQQAFEIQTNFGGASNGRNNAVAHSFDHRPSLMNSTPSDLLRNFGKGPAGPAGLAAGGLPGEQKKKIRVNRNVMDQLRKSKENMGKTQSIFDRNKPPSNGLAASRPNFDHTSSGLAIPPDPEADGASYVAQPAAGRMRNTSLLSGRSNTSNTTEKRGIKLKNVRLSTQAMRALNTRKQEMIASQKLNMTEIRAEAPGADDTVQDISQDTGFTALRGAANMNQSMFYAPSNNNMMLEDLDAIQDGNADDETTNLRSPTHQEREKAGLVTQGSFTQHAGSNQPTGYDGRSQFPEGGNRNSFRLMAHSNERPQEENRPSSGNHRHRRSNVFLDTSENDMQDNNSRQDNPDRFSKLINREGEDTFVERIDKQARIQLQRSDSQASGHSGVALAIKEQSQPGYHNIPINRARPGKAKRYGGQKRKDGFEGAWTNEDDSANARGATSNNEEGWSGAPGQADIQDNEFHLQQKAQAEGIQIPQEKQGGGTSNVYNFYNYYNIQSINANSTSPNPQNLSGTIGSQSSSNQQYSNSNNRQNTNEQQHQEKKVIEDW